MSVSCVVINVLFEFGYLEPDNKIGNNGVVKFVRKQVNVDSRRYFRSGKRLQIVLTFVR